MRKEIFFLIVFFLASCSSKSSMFQHYTYEAELKKYFKEELNLNLENYISNQQIDYFFIIRLDGCSTCLERTMNNILNNQNKNNIGILLLGEPREQQVKLANQIKSNFANVLLDDSSHFGDYELDVFGPTIFSFSKKGIKYIPLTDTKWVSLKKELSWD